MTGRHGHRTSGTPQRAGVVELHGAMQPTARFGSPGGLIAIGLAVSVAVLLAGCSRPDALLVEPEAIVVAVGQTMHAEALAADGLSRAGKVTWTTGNEYVASVSRGGTVTGNHAGITELYGVARGGAFGRAQVTVVTAKDSLGLIISEIGASAYASSDTWVEIYNPTSDPIDLGSYSLRSTARLGYDSWDQYQDVTFELPSIIVEPGSYALLVAAADEAYENTDQLVFLKTADDLVPNWAEYDGGFVELIVGGETADFVPFGASEAQPTTEGTWSGDPAPDTPEWDYGYQSWSIARRADLRDTNTAADWELRQTATPGGPNDVTSTVDSDGDGIPDANEQPGATFAGLPLYEWGARADTPDIFVQLAYLDSGTPGMRPTEFVLEKVADVFAAEGIALHWDVGDLFDAADGINTERHDLSDADYASSFTDCVTPETGTGCVSFYEIKYETMDLARKSIFHFGLHAHRREQPYEDHTRYSEVGGNDFILFWGWAEAYDPGDTAESNYLTNVASAYTLYVLGRNLGLTAAGGDEEYYKPNYVSTMNYLYDAEGLPPVGTAAEGDRHYVRFDLNGYSSYHDLDAGPYDDPELFRIGFSHGLGDSIDETAVDESRGLYQPESAPVDYDGDGDDEEVLANFDANSPDGAGIIGTLHDHDDWAAIELNFITDSGGTMSTDRWRWEGLR